MNRMAYFILCFERTHGSGATTRESVPALTDDISVQNRNQIGLWNSYLRT